MKFETRYLRPSAVINQKEFRRKQYGSLYRITAEVIQKFCEINHMYGDVIFKYKLRTSYGAVYGDTEYAAFNGNEFTWEFQNDFDEGEDYITITDICYLHEIFSEE